jgi:NACHT domain
MIEKVWAIWITGVLQPSLPHDILLDLGLTERPAMVARTLDLYVQRPDLADQVQAPGTQLTDVFERLDRALLILGAPGAGKTTLLLTLARDLLIRAARDPEQPIPVVFPLSSWATQQRPFADWLVEALSEQYQVPREIGHTWVARDQILPLLDGLDEVALEHRAACVEAINAFRQEHGLLPLVVCSRVADYEALGLQLRLQGTLVVQPLTRTQVENYLTEVGQPLAAVREALGEDPTLWELLDTPLMLTIMSLAHAGKPVGALRASGTLEARHRALFTAYVNRMFQRRSVITAYARQQTERWLAWMAWQMTQRSQTVFYLERMQPSWLETRRQKRLYACVSRLLFGFVTGLLGGWIGLIYILASMLIMMVIDPSIELFGTFFEMRWSGLLIITAFSGPCGSIIGLIIGLIKMNKYSNEHIDIVEKLEWSWPLVMEELKKLVQDWRKETRRISYHMWIQDIVFFVVRFVFAFRHGLRTVISEDQFILNQNILWSAKCAVKGTLSGIFYGTVFVLLIQIILTIVNIILLIPFLPFGSSASIIYIIQREIGVRILLAILAGMLLGPIFGSIGVLRYGGRPYIQHYTLRLIFWYKGVIPREYNRFLDYATSRIFLRKVGGGYIFIHRLLLEHFANVNMA